jgi:hypothetical protein
MTGCSAVSRAYYAAFHWAVALLFLKGLEPTKVPIIVQTSDRWTPNSGRRLAALGVRGPPQSLSNLFQERW